MLVCQQVHDPSWKNQDAGLAIAPIGQGEAQALFAIFDGERACCSENNSEEDSDVLFVPDIGILARMSKVPMTLPSVIYFSGWHRRIPE